MPNNEVYITRLEPDTASQNQLSEVEKVILHLHRELEALKKKRINPRDVKLFEMAREYSNNCGLKNFMNKDEILLAQANWVHGYEAALDNCS